MSQTSSNQKKIMIMAGGTGGHVFPGIALAMALQKQGVEISWLGTVAGMETAWVENAGLPIHSITIKGLRGNGWRGWLAAPFNVIRAWWQARKIMRRVRPDLVLGMGGFVCGPGGLAAKSLGIPLALHEQNAIPGLTNKLLAPLSKLVICAFPQQKITGKNVVTIGNPVREGLEQIAQVQESDKCELLVLGGSRGALTLNENLPRALALMAEEIRPNVVHQTGEKTLSEAQQAYSEAGVEAEVISFIDDMEQAYAKADLLVCRSGALTVSELMAVARPAIMVPYPHAVDDHQTANAQALLNLDGGEIIQQDQLSPELLAERLTEWCSDSGKRVEASNNIRQAAKQKATEIIVEKLQEIMR